MSKPARIPGPSRLQLLRALPRIRRELVEYLRELSDQYGESYFLPLRYPTYVLTNPHDIKHILVTNPRNYHKTGGLTFGREIFGDGLVSSEPPLHTRQRRLMQPMFHGSSIATFGEIMTRAALEQVANWRDGDSVELANDIMQITLTVVGRALFSIDLCREASELGNAFTLAQRLLTRRQQRVPIPLWVPTPANRQYLGAISHINDSIANMIAARRRLPESEWPRDLLTMLLSARFEDGSMMPEAQLRDECVTLVMAGHETVTNTLLWTWYLISQHPDVEAKLVGEWGAVFGDHTPTVADYPALRYTNMVLSESMRLYPPAWTLARKVLKDDPLPSGLTLPAGCEAILVQYICHRNGKYFPEPDKFNPNRFDPETKPYCPQYAYFPFGGGPRYCIGESFAKLEAALVLATIGRRFELRLSPGHRIGLEPLISLRPRYGMRMIIKERPNGGKSQSNPVTRSEPVPAA
jgi:cytochrome P450